MHFTALGIEIFLSVLIVIAIIGGTLIIRQPGTPGYGKKILSSILALLIILFFLALFILIFKLPPTFQFS